jgi:DHA1 family multidrug resistance protein-like MFS transporter
VERLRAVRGPLGILSLISFVSALGVSVMLPLIPLYAVSLGAAPVQLGLLTSAFAVATTVAQVGAGLFMDRYGARGFIRGGIATYAGANFLIATARSAVSLISFRTIAGLGGGTNLVATRLYLSQVTAPERMAFANGVLSAAVSAGQVAGPVLGGVVAALANLRLPFIMVGITSALGFLGALFLPRPAPVSPSAGLLTGGAPPRIFTRDVMVLLFAQLFLLAGYGGFITTYAPFATRELGWSTLDVGIVFSFFGAGSILLGPWLSHLADRTGRRRIAALSTLPVAAFGAVLVAGAPKVGVYAISILAGGALTAFTGSWFALLSAASPSVRRGRTFGLVSAGSNLGQVAGAMGASAVWQQVTIGAGLLSASFPVLLCGLTLLLLPRDRSPTNGVRGPGSEVRLQAPTDSGHRTSDTEEQE